MTKQALGLLEAAVVGRRPHDCLSHQAAITPFPIFMHAAALHGTGKQSAHAG